LTAVRNDQDANRGSDAASDADSLRAPYHRTTGEMLAMPVIETTKTICPECKLVIEGIIYKDGNIVMIRKECPEHGMFVEKYWEDYDLYMKMRRYNYSGRGFDNPDIVNKGDNCPFDCAMCIRHKSHSGLVNVVVTNRCHLSCYYCFFFSKEGDAVYEPSKNELNRMFAKLRNQRPIPANALQLTGGEPTLREDLYEIVTMAKEAGFNQIQLNTTGINLGLHPEMLEKLRFAGLSTLYLSFDGTTKRTNPKNHWEIPLTLKAARKAEVGIVLVPTIIRGSNDQELGPIINFALNNIDIVRAVNFQPVSLVGRMPAKEREKQRITIPGAIKLIEEQTNGDVSRDDWFSVPYVGGINNFIESLTGEYKYDLSTHFACGVGNYLFLDDNNKVIPLTRFVDAAGLFEHLQGAVNEMHGKSSMERKFIATKTMMDLDKYIDREKQPKSINFPKLLMNVLLKHDYASVGKFQVKTLFLGMMHFMDEYNYDIKRVEKCSVSYSMPDGRIVPFCSFNVIPELYRDKVQKQYAMPSSEWQEAHKGWTYAKDKYRRDVAALEAKKEYDDTYNKKIDFFSLPVNAGSAGERKGVE
jgi:7,8-dihydro-6-hydroxymethylpterin dimethyltransferase